MRYTRVWAIVADKVDVNVVAAVGSNLSKLEVRAGSDGLLRARAVKPREDDGHSRCAAGVFILLQQLSLSLYTLCAVSIQHKRCVAACRE